MDYDRFVEKEKQTFDELVNWLIMNPTEETLRKCVKAISFRILLNYPNMKNNLDKVIEHSWIIVERHLLPMMEKKQNRIVNVMGLNNSHTDNSHSLSNKVFQKAPNNISGGDILRLFVCGLWGFLGGGFLINGLFNDGGGGVIFCSLPLLILGIGGLYACIDDFKNRNK